MADGRLLFDTKINTTGFKTGLTALNRMTSGAMGTFSSALSGGITAFKNFHKLGGIALLGIGGVAVKMGADFEQQMSRVQAIAGATKAELKELSDQALELGADTSFSAKEAADGMENLASAGFKTSEIMSAMPGLLDLAAVSGGDVAKASEVAATTIRAFGMEAKSAGHIADVFAKAAADTNAEVGDMGEAMKYVAPVAHAMGQSMEMTAAAIGIMSDAGIKGTQAGTTLRAGLTRLVKMSGPASDVVKELGMSFHDASGNMIPLSGIIGELKDKTAGLTQEEKNHAIVTIFGREALSGMLALMDAGPEKLDKMTESFISADGSAKDMATTMLDNVKGAVEELMGSLETLGISLYSLKSGAFKELAQSATGYVNQITEALNGTATSAEANSMRTRNGLLLINDGFATTEGGAKNMAQTIGSIVSDIAIKLAEQAPGLITTGLEVIGAFIAGIKSADMATLGTQIITAIINGITNYLAMILPLGVEIITSIAEGMANTAPSLINTIQTALGTLISTIVANLPILLESGSKILTEILNGIMESMPLLVNIGMEILTMLINSLVENLPQVATTAIGILQTLVDGIIANLPMIIPAVISLITSLIDTLVENLPLLLDMGIQILTAVVNGIVENLPTLIPAILSMITSISDTLIANLPLLLELGITLLMAIIDGIIQSLPFLIAEAPRIINSFADTIYAMLPTILATGWNMIVELGKGIINNIPLIIQNAGAIFTAFLNIFTLSSLFNLGGKLIEFLTNGIKNLGPNLMSTGQTLFNSLINLIGKIFTGALNLGKGLITKLISGIGSIGPNLLSVVRGLITNLMGTITSIFTGALNLGKTLINDIIGGIKGVVGNLLNTGKTLATDVINSIKGPFSSAFNIGKDLIFGIWNGISNVTGWITDKIKGFSSNVLSSIKGFFGIKSPSKVLAKEVGRWLPPGISVGMEAEMPDLIKTADDEMENLKNHMKSGLEMDLAGSFTGTDVIPTSQFDYVLQDGNKTIALAGAVEVTTYLDSKAVGFGSARFVAEENALSKKRRA